MTRPLMWSLLIGAVLLAGCRADPPKRRQGTKPAATPDIAQQPTEATSERGAEAHEAKAGAATPSKRTAVPVHWLGRSLGPSRVVEGHEEDVAFTIDEASFTLGDIDGHLRTMPPTALGVLGNANGRREMLEDLALFEMLAGEAEARGLAGLPSVRFAQLVGLAAAMRQSIRDDVLREGIDEQQVAGYYEAHAEQFRAPARRRGAMMTFEDATSAAALAKSISEAAPTANPARMRLFEKHAREGSLHATTKAMGGRIGPVARDSRDPKVPAAVRERLFGLEPFTISEPFELEGRWALVMYTGSTPAREIPLETAESGIRQRLAAEQAPAVWKEFVDRTEERLEAKKTVNPAALDHIRVREVGKGSPLEVTVEPGFEDGLVVSVGDTAIAADVAAIALSRLPIETRQAFDDPAARSQFLRSLGRLASVAEAARVKGMEDASLARLHTRRQLVHALESRVEDAVPTAEVSSEAVRAWYDEHRTRYQSPERRRVVHAVFATVEDARAARQSLADAHPDGGFELVEALRALAAQKGADGVVGGGRLPYAAREPVTEGIDVPAEIRAAAFGLERFQLSEPVQTEQGWHLLAVDGMRSAVDIPFERVRASIELELSRRPRVEAVEALKQRLRSEHKVTLHSEVLEHVVGPPAGMHQH